MNAAKLAKEAVNSTSPHARSVSDEVRRELALAYVARWLMRQDDSVLAKASETAVAAIAMICTD